MANRYPEWTYSAALAALPLQTPLRLRRLIALDTPSHVWDMLQAGERPLVGVNDVVWRAWHKADASLLVSTAEACIDSSMTVVSMRDAPYPPSLLGDPSAPGVLFMIGDAGAFHNRRVGIIGTRHATQRGKYFSQLLGKQLSAAGVSVVSGLARGIDVESHVGALSLSAKDGCPPIAIVASGLDMVYPPEHERIWGEIGRRGLLISESPPGTPPEPHRFPMRNRILAALSEVLVVVESHATGGSMITVREAMKRDITVLAVPGAPGIAPCEGTNNLLRDGCGPVTDVTDVLVALGLDHRHMTDWCEGRPALQEDERHVMTVLGRVPRSMDEISLGASLTVVNVAVILGRLEAKGWVANTNGWWEALVA
jgi:DNA processing protein